MFGVPSLHLFMFIFFGSPLLSDQNNKSSIIFIPVIMFPKNFKTAFPVPAFLSTNTGEATSWSISYSNITSLSYLDINQYSLLFFSSAILPTQLKSDPTKLSTLLFPRMFCTVPTSDPSDVETSTFNACRYCPFGTSLSSRSLFILPPVKLCLTSGILINVLFV